MYRKQWLNRWDSIYLHVAVIGQLSNDWPWPHAAMSQKSEKTPAYL